MKKNQLVLLGSLVIVCLLIYVGIKVVRNAGSSVESELIDFAISEIEKIDRIVLTDSYGRNMDLRLSKEDKKWTDAQGNCIMQQNIQLILEACKNIEFKGYLPEESLPTYHNIIVTKHIQVDYFLNGKWSKTWYIGPATKDHLGQIMLLKSKELGQSDRPVIMAIKGTHGIIEPRFFADPLLWKCSEIFAIPADKIQKVDVTYPLEPARSFSVENTGKNNYEVKQQNIPVPKIDTQFVLLYLNKFKKIHYEEANYELTNVQIDSLKKTTPFCRLTITLKDKNNIRLRMFRIPSEQTNINEFGDPVQHDTNRFWAELPSGEIVKCQHFVFDPILLGHIYFPLDLSSLNLKNHTPIAPEHYQHR